MENILKKGFTATKDAINTFAKKRQQYRNREAFTFHGMLTEAGNKKDFHTLMANYAASSALSELEFENVFDKWPPFDLGGKNDIPKLSSLVKSADEDTTELEVEDDDTTEDKHKTEDKSKSAAARLDETTEDYDSDYDEDDKKHEIDEYDSYDSSEDDEDEDEDEEEEIAPEEQAKTLQTALDEVFKDQPTKAAAIQEEANAIRKSLLYLEKTTLSNPKVIAELLQQETQRLLKTLKTYHKKEIDKFEKLFDGNNKDFMDALKEAYAAETGQDMQNIKEAALATVNDRHNKEKNALKAWASVNSAIQHQKKCNKRLAGAYLSQFNKDKIAEENSASIDISIDDLPPELKGSGLNFDEMREIRIATGTVITKDKSGTLNIKFNENHDTAKIEMYDLVMAMIALGIEKGKAEFDKESLAEMFYETIVRAGLDPKDFKIKYKNDEGKIEDFSPTAEIKESAQQARDQAVMEQKMADKAAMADIKQMKQAMLSLRNKMPKEEVFEEPAGPTIPNI